MRPQQHKKALARLAVGVSAAALVPVGVAAASMSVAPLAVAALGAATILGASALRSPRRRVTRSSAV